MINNLSNTVKAELYGRISSPLFASFLMSFMVWNFQAILVLFSSLPVFTKIHHLEYEIYTHLFDSIILLVFAPLMSALLFIFVYPIPAKIVYEHTRKEQQKLKKIRVKIEDETPLSEEESRKIKQDMIDMDNKYSEYVATTAKKIEDLERTYKAKEVELISAHDEKISGFKSDSSGFKEKLFAIEGEHKKSIRLLEREKETLIDNHDSAESIHDDEIKALNSKIKIISSKQKETKIKLDTAVDNTSVASSRIFSILAGSHDIPSTVKAAIERQLTTLNNLTTPIPSFSQSLLGGSK